MGPPELLETVEELCWDSCTKVQEAVVPYALSKPKSDLIVSAKTGSGKTAAFVLPIIARRLDMSKHEGVFAVVLSPTRELALQIADVFRLFGKEIGLRVCSLIGGQNKGEQAIELFKKPHIVVGSPGRIADHVQTTKGFKLNTLEYLVLDEADQLMSPDFDHALRIITEQTPQGRVTYMFSATINSKIVAVKKLLMSDPKTIFVDGHTDQVNTLDQRYLFIPHKYKFAYLHGLINKLRSEKRVMIFTQTCLGTLKVCAFLNELGYRAAMIHGKMEQHQRQRNLESFKKGDKQILVSTEVGARGLDIPEVSFVLIFELPEATRDYIHRVGRTARAGQTGTSILFITQYDIATLQSFEKDMGFKLAPYDFKLKKEHLEATTLKISQASRIADTKCIEFKAKLKKHNK